MLKRAPGKELVSPTNDGLAKRACGLAPTDVQLVAHVAYVPGCSSPAANRASRKP